MDPARPNEPDPADPFYPEHGDQAVLETIEIATEGEDCNDCVRKLRSVLKKIAGVKDVKVDQKHERVVVTFDARKTHPPDLHDAILNGGYQTGSTAHRYRNAGCDRGLSLPALRAGTQKSSRWLLLG